VLFSCHALLENLLLQFLLEVLVPPDLVLQLLHLFDDLYVLIHRDGRQRLYLMMPCLVPAPATGAQCWVWIETPTLTTLCIAGRLWLDETALASRELDLSAGRGSRQVKQWLWSGVEHQEVTWCSFGQNPGRAASASWDADEGAMKVGVEVEVEVQVKVKVKMKVKVKSSDTNKPMKRI
jgi:hypothetical protein